MAPPDMMAPTTVALIFLRQYMPAPLTAACRGDRPAYVWQPSRASGRFSRGSESGIVQALMKKRTVRTLLLLGAGSLIGFAADRAWRLSRDNDRRRKIIANYTEANRAPKPGDILLFYRPGVLADHVIQTVTGSRVYHTALFVESDENGPVVLEALTSGVQISRLRDTGREGDYVVVPAPRGKGEAALAWACTKIGSPYDYKDGLAIGLEHVFKHWHVNYTYPGRYTCGELVATAFEKVGVTLVPGKQLYEVSPGDISAAAFGPATVST